MLKLKTILILALVFCPLLEKGYAVNPVAIVEQPFSMSAEEREALNQNIMGRLKTAFLGEEIRGISPELAQRMDEVFYREVRKRIASLTPTQLRKVEEIVMRDRDFPDTGLRAMAGVTGIDFSNFHPAIVFNPNFPLHHPYRRMVLIHELEHVIDLGLGLDIGRNRTSVLRTEMGATIVEYQYITRVFNQQDLEDLYRNFPVLPSNLIVRVMEEFLPFPQHTNNEILVEDLSAKEAVARFINGHFMVKVRLALTVDQDTYVEAILATYRQLFGNTEDPPAR